MYLLMNESEMENKTGWKVYQWNVYVYHML